MGSVKRIRELVVNLHGFEYCVFIWETGKSRIYLYGCDLRYKAKKFSYNALLDGIK